MSALNESIVEDAALTWFGELGYAIAHGPHMAPGEPAAERDSFADVVLGRLRRPSGVNQAINPHLATLCDALPPKLLSGSCVAAAQETEVNV